MPDELRFRERPRFWAFTIPYGPPRTQVHDTLKAAVEWCEANLEVAQWDCENREIIIYDETVAAAFKLRWC